MLGWQLLCIVLAGCARCATAVYCPGMVCSMSDCLYFPGMLCSVGDCTILPGDRFKLKWQYVRDGRLLYIAIAICA